MIERELTITEKTLQKRVGKLQDDLAQKIVDGVSGNLDIPGAGGPVDITKVAKKATSSKSGSKGSLSAVEARYLSMTTGQNRTEVNTSKIAVNTQKQINLTERLIALITGGTEIKANGPRVAISNFQ